MQRDHRPRGRDVAAAHVFGKRAADQIPVVVSSERRERLIHTRGSGTGSTAANGELRLLGRSECQVPDVRRRPKILRSGRERLETLRQNGAFDHGLHRPLLERLDPANLSKRSACLLEHLHRVRRRGPPIGSTTSSAVGHVAR